jgi:hypothetical protein
VPGAQSTNEDTNLVFSSGNGNLISISDSMRPGELGQVTLTATNGTLTLAGIDRADVHHGDGTATRRWSSPARVANINAALAGMSFAPTANYNGAASRADHDRRPGQHGIGGAQTDTDTVNITVNAVNDARSTPSRRADRSTKTRR